MFVHLQDVQEWHELLATKIDSIVGDFKLVLD